MRAAVPAGKAHVPWWRDRRRRDRATVYGFAVLGVGGILLAGALRFAEGDQRQVVVTLQRTPDTTLPQLSEARQTLKDDCGDLPGVTVVPDRGAAAAQPRFPVRFSIRGATNPQRAALDACLARHGDVVRAFSTEGEE